MSIQDDFIAALEALAPKGYIARIQPRFANSGAIFYQDTDFQTLLGVSYDFQDSYASFNLTKITTTEKTAISARQTGSKPGSEDFTWDGWGHVSYAKGELKQVREGVAYLLKTRTGSSRPVKSPSSDVTLTSADEMRFERRLLEEGR
jgi:hypothetical protein